MFDYEDTYYNKYHVQVFKDTIGETYSDEDDDLICNDDYYIPIRDYIRPVPLKQKLYKEIKQQIAEANEIYHRRNYHDTLPLLDDNKNKNDDDDDDDDYNGEPNIDVYVSITFNLDRVNENPISDIWTTTGIIHNYERYRVWTSRVKNPQKNILWLLHGQLRKSVPKNIIHTCHKHYMELKRQHSINPEITKPTWKQYYQLYREILRNHKNDNQLIKSPFGDNIYTSIKFTNRHQQLTKKYINDYIDMHFHLSCSHDFYVTRYRCVFDNIRRLNPELTDDQMILISPEIYHFVITTRPIISKCIFTNTTTFY